MTKNKAIQTMNSGIALIIRKKSKLSNSKQYQMPSKRSRKTRLVIILEN